MILVIEPKLTIYQEGISEIKVIEDRTEQINEYYKKAIREVAKRYNFKIKMLTLENEEIEQIYANLVAAHTSMNFNYFNSDQPKLPTKENVFDYDIGSIENLLKSNNADYLMFAYGYAFETTASKTGTQVAGFLLGVFTGIYVIPRSEKSHIAISFTNAGGNIELVKTKFLSKKAVSSLVQFQKTLLRMFKYAAID